MSKNIFVAYLHSAKNAPKNNRTLSCHSNYVIAHGQSCQHFGDPRNVMSDQTECYDGIERIFWWDFKMLRFRSY